MNPHVYPRGNERIQGTTKEVTEAKARAREQSSLIQEKTWICTRASLMSWSHVVCPRLFYVVRWQQLSWRYDQSLYSFPVYLPWFHLGAKGTKRDGLSASVALSFSPSWATQSPMCSQLSPLHTPVLCNHYLSLSLCSECLYTGFFSFHPLFLFICIHFLLITDYQLCRTSL